jgi:endonuclease YncB( thermonuclease family)
VLALARVALALCSVGGLIWFAPSAAAQERYAATVVEVVAGDTVDAQLSTGPTLRVRLLGIDAPEVGDCGADPATASLEQLVLGHTVSLVTDPSQDAVDQFGRSVFYVDGPVRVSGDDPYDLDRDGDGVGCDS